MIFGKQDVGVIVPRGHCRVPVLQFLCYSASSPASTLSWFILTVNGPLFSVHVIVICDHCTVPPLDVNLNLQTLAPIEITHLILIPTVWRVSRASCFTTFWSPLQWRSRPSSNLLMLDPSRTPHCGWYAGTLTETMLEKADRISDAKKDCQTPRLSSLMKKSSKTFLGLTARRGVISWPVWRSWAVSPSRSPVSYPYFGLILIPLLQYFCA